MPQIKVCACKLITLGGPCEVVGEVEIELGKWATEGGKLTVHVVERMTREYSGIIGCDWLKRVGARVRNKGGKWNIRIGEKRYRGKRDIKCGPARIGAVNHREDWRETIKREYADVFFREGEALGVTGETVHEIPMKQNRVIYVKERRYPQALRQHIREELEDLKSQGIIVDSTSPYNSPLWAVKKKSIGENGREKYRVVVDFRKLNENTVDEKYPIPRFEDILDRLSGATVFSTLDLKAGYHQIRMHPDDQHKTAFTFERGHFQFTRMPFGLKNAPITFQRLMDELLRGIEETFCQIYMDDLLVFSKNEREHAEHLRKVLARLRQFGLKLSEEKSIIGQKEIKFLGHSISEQGVRPDSQKVEAIQRMAMPTDVKGIRRLLGTLNYYRRFVPEMAKYLVPLNNLLKKGQKIRITPATEENIRECMRWLQKEPVLAFPDFTRQFIVTTDASEYALGAVLAQEGKEGEKPVAYASRRLTEAETRYSALERELLGIVWAIDHFRPYLFGRKFKVHTDHRPLLWVGKMKESSARVTRWKEFLSQYNLEISYKPGKDNVVADWLSRAIQINAIEEEGEGSGDVRRFLRDWTPEGEGNRETEGSPVEESSDEERTREIEEIDEMINDKQRQVIWKTRTAGLMKAEYAAYGKCKITTIWSQPGAKEEHICQALKDASKPGKTHHVYVGNSVIWEKIKKLWREEKIGTDRNFIRCTIQVETIRDPERQKEVTLAHHQGKTNHRGISETHQALKRRYFWWGMRRTIEEVIGKCEVCHTTKYDRSPPKGRQEETQTPMTPLSELQIDTFTWQGHKWVTIIDVFSKLAMAHPISERSAEAVMRALRMWFQFYGLPDRITSDGGREFDNSTIRTEMKEVDVEWHVNTPGHPKSRGAVERLHGTLSEHLRVYYANKGLEPDVAMPRAVAAYNHSIHSVTGFSPFEVLFGLRERRRSKEETVSDEDRAQQLRNNRVTLGKIWGKVRRKIETEKRRRVERENTGLRDAMEGIRIGTIVYRKIESNRGKEWARYEGPFKVITIREHNVVTVQSLKDPRKRRNVHIEQLKIPARETDQT